MTFLAECISLVPAGLVCVALLLGALLSFKWEGWLIPVAVFGAVFALGSAPVAASFASGIYVLLWTVFTLIVMIRVGQLLDDDNDETLAWVGASLAAGALIFLTSGLGFSIWVRSGIVTGGVVAYVLLAFGTSLLKVILLTRKVRIARNTRRAEWLAEMWAKVRRSTDGMDGDLVQAIRVLPEGHAALLAYTIPEGALLMAWEAEASRDRRLKKPNLLEMKSKIFLWGVCWPATLVNLALDDLLRYLWDTFYGWASRRFVWVRDATWDNTQ